MIFIFLVAAKNASKKAKKDVEAEEEEDAEGRRTWAAAPGVTGLVSGRGEDEEALVHDY